MFTGKKRVIGKDPIALLTAQCGLVPMNVHDVPVDPFGGRLGQPCPPVLLGCPEEQDAVLHPRAQRVLGRIQDIQAQNLLANQNDIPVAERNWLPNPKENAIHAFEIDQHRGASAFDDSGVSWGQVGIVLKFDRTPRSADVDLSRIQTKPLSVGTVFLYRNQRFDLWNGLFGRRLGLCAAVFAEVSTGFERCFATPTVGRFGARGFWRSCSE